MEIIQMTHQNKNKIGRCVLIIVAHPDDETIGLGGTIARHTMNGDAVYCIAMTDGVGARGGNIERQIKIRTQASLSAKNILGFNWLKGGNFPDNGMDKAPLLEVVKIIEQAKLIVNPSLIYTHSSADLNIDHRTVCQATLIAFRPQPKEIWEEIRTFEVPSATDYGHKSVTNAFYPNLFVNISGTWEKKLAALREYKHEIRSTPHSRSYKGIENLAKYRGNQVGLDYAEAFETIRKIER